MLIRAVARLKVAPRRRHRPTPKVWADALRAGIDGIIELGGAGRGDRTMLDALLPAYDALSDGLAVGWSASEALSAAAFAAETGARAPPT